MTYMHAATGFCSLLPDQSTYIKHTQHSWWYLTSKFNSESTFNPVLCSSCTQWYYCVYWLQEIQSQLFKIRDALCAISPVYYLLSDWWREKYCSARTTTSCRHSRSIGIEVDNCKIIALSIFIIILIIHWLQDPTYSSTIIVEVSNGDGLWVRESHCSWNSMNPVCEMKIT